jgi:hypothetical protein
MTSPLIPLEQAAIPTAIAAIKAFQQFEVDLGSDPLKIVANLGPAKLKLLGNLGLLLQPLGVAEVSAAEGVVNTVGNGWIAKLEAAQSPTATIAPVTPA